MSSSMGILRWSPAEFWAASFFEYSCAMKGYLASKGVKSDNEPYTRNEFLEDVAREKKGIKRGNGQ